MPTAPLNPAFKTGVYPLMRTPIEKKFFSVFIMLFSLKSYAKSPVQYVEIIF